LISVAVPVPFLDLLTYRVPDVLPVPSIGARVRVPLGSRTVTGIVVSHEPDPGSRIPDADTIKDVAEVLDRDPFLLPTVVALCRWVAEYYMAGIGDAMTTALPPGAQTRASGFKTQRVVSATAHGLSVVEGFRPKLEATLPAQAGSYGARLPPEAGSCEEQARGRVASGVGPVASGVSPVTSGFSRKGKQTALLDVLAGAPAGLPASDLRDRGFGSDVIARLVSKGLATIRDEQDDRDPFERAAAMTAVAPDATRQLTPEQAEAFQQLAALADSGEYRVALLHGVTGSGKTELYLRLADRVVRAGRHVLLLVPEIALTPSVAALFRGAFGNRVAIQHSGLSDGERHDQWHRIRRGEVDVVVGTRSAVFTPLARPGLIIVDEEHDTSYKQEESPRYHGRDVAVMRASREGALVVLGSATPSMESYQNALAGKYALVTLERRVLDRPLAAVRVVNMRDEYADEGPDVVVSRELVSGVEDRLARQEQVLVLLNRRGFATAVFCRQCGDTFDCPNCSVSLTVHTARHGWRARCHYCNYSMMVPKQCRKCAAPYLEHAGFGTEKVEQQLKDRFPDARIGRIDRDSVRRKGTLTALLTKFSSGALDVLVGTQMIAKGHDFPRVTLVGVISADVGLGLADFRAAERTFQLLTQVAGRSGRGDRTGEAIVQTLYPEHYSIRLACRQDYPAFFEKELNYRRGMRYPPLVAMINIVVRGRTFDEAMGTAIDITARLGPATATGPFAILGPAPAPLGRLRGEHRVQFFLKGQKRASMREALKTVLAGVPEVRRRVSVDVDPLTVL
jgi:primosomal protein N' (replication factor Y)